MNALTREQLEDRLAALHQASLELVQDFSLESLLTRIASLAREQAKASYAALGVLSDNGKLEKFIPIGMTDQEVAAVPHLPKGLGLLGVLMRSNKPVRVNNIAADRRRVGFPPHHPAMTSFLGVPIRQRDRQLGQIYLTNKIDGTEFTAEDELVMETLAAYAAVAISNAKLYQQLTQRDRVLTQRNENLALVNNLAATMAGFSDINQTLDKVLTQVMEYLHIQCGEIYLKPEDSRSFSLVLHKGEKFGHIWTNDKFHTGEGAVGSTAALNQPHFSFVDGEDGQYIHPDAIANGVHLVASFPIAGRGGPMGVLCVTSRESRQPDELDMQLLSAICSWLGAVVENMRLGDQQRRLAILEERERIGMDLHDGIIQSIYAVGLTLEHARLIMKETPDQSRQRIDQAINDLNSTIRDIRAYILDLRPRQLHDDDLMRGLRKLATEFHNNTMVDVNLEGPPEGTIDIPSNHSLALFLICQEALSNIAKHARAAHVDVVLWQSSDRVLLEVHDDGRGFDPEKAHLTLGHGLSNMQTRARNVGGEVEITSENSSGTTILAWVPLTDE